MRKLFFFPEIYTVCLAPQHLDRSLRRPISNSDSSEWVSHTGLSLFASSTSWAVTPSRGAPASHVAGSEVMETCDSFHKLQVEFSQLCWVTVWPWGIDVSVWWASNWRAVVSCCMYAHNKRVEIFLFGTCESPFIRWGVKLKSAAMKHRAYRDASVPERFSHSVEQHFNHVQPVASGWSELDTCQTVALAVKYEVVEGKKNTRTTSYFPY